jgi:hypothetical protein
MSMQRGLMWLPLLVAFIGLAWAGWNEYQKLQAYERWAEQFDRYKYDIYAALGQKGDELTWGKPTRKEPIDRQSVKLSDIQQVQLCIDGGSFGLDDPNLPERGKSIAIALLLKTDATASIPFTDVSIAADWYRYLLGQVNPES